MTDPLSPDVGGDAPTDRAVGAGTHDPVQRTAALPPLPDLTGVDLETLRTLDHPVLTDMVTELRERAERPREMLWGFNNGSPNPQPPRLEPF